MNVDKKPFGKVDGKNVDLYTITNAKGVSMAVTNYGGIITSLVVPDKNGAMADVALGYNDIDSYVKSSPYFGAIVGRFGNRIAKATFSLDGKTYTLAANNGPNCLHGGNKGFDKVVWDAQEIRKGDAAGVELRYTSADGEEGFPGNLKCEAVYLLDDDDRLTVEFSATTDKATVVNLSQHSYFNLAGEGRGDILGHELMLNADRFVPVDATLIPTGEIPPVKGTPMDFATKPTAIGARINADFEQLRFGKGYDHCWVLNQKKPGEMTLAARVYERTSGRTLEIATTEPAIQFYCGNFLDGSNVGKRGTPYNFRNGFALETEHYPDSPNKPQFPSVVLRPAQTYKTMTVFAFSAK